MRTYPTEKAIELIMNLKWKSSSVKYIGIPPCPKCTDFYRRMDNCSNVPQFDIYLEGMKEYGGKIPDNPKMVCVCYKCNHRRLIDVGPMNQEGSKDVIRKLYHNEMAILCNYRNNHPSWAPHAVDLDFDNKLGFR